MRIVDCPNPISLVFFMKIVPQLLKSFLIAQPWEVLTLVSAKIMARNKILQPFSLKGINNNDMKSKLL